jgi:hypothetical protein
VTLRNNFIYRNTEAGISIGGYDKQRGSTEQVAIVNNTLYENDSHAGGSGELQLQFDTRDNSIYNNIFYVGSQGLFISNWSKANSGNRVDKNFYFGAQGGGEWQWKNKSYESFDAYVLATGNDKSSLFDVDPRLVNLVIPDLHLQAASPAIDKGVSFDDIVGSTDIDGEARVQGGEIEIGADEVR